MSDEIESDLCVLYDLPGLTFDRFHAEGFRVLRSVSQNGNKSIMPHDTRRQQMNKNGCTARSYTTALQKIKSQGDVLSAVSPARRILNFLSHCIL